MPEDLDEMYRIFTATDNAHWLQHNIMSMSMDVNVAWNTKGNQRTKMVAHGGRNSSKKSDKEKARIIGE